MDGDQVSEEERSQILLGLFIERGNVPRRIDLRYVGLYMMVLLSLATYRNWAEEPLGVVVIALIAIYTYRDIAAVVRLRSDEEEDALLKLQSRRLTRAIESQRNVPLEGGKELILLPGSVPLLQVGDTGQLWEVVRYSDRPPDLLILKDGWVYPYELPKYPSRDWVLSITPGPRDTIRTGRLFHIPICLTVKRLFDKS